MKFSWKTKWWQHPSFVFFLLQDTLLCCCVNSAVYCLFSCCHFLLWTASQISQRIYECGQYIFRFFSSGEVIRKVPHTLSRSTEFQCYLVVWTCSEPQTIKNAGMGRLYQLKHKYLWHCLSLAHFTHWSQLTGNESVMLFQGVPFTGFLLTAFLILNKVWGYHTVCCALQKTAKPEAAF